MKWIYFWDIVKLMVVGQSCTVIGWFRVFVRADQPLMNSKSDKGERVFGGCAESVIFYHYFWRFISNYSSPQTLDVIFRLVRDVFHNGLIFIADKHDSFKWTDCKNLQYIVGIAETCAVYC